MGWSDFDTEQGLDADGAPLAWALVILVGTIVAGAALVALALWGV